MHVFGSFRIEKLTKFSNLQIYWQHTNSISDGVDDREATKGDIQHFCLEIYTHMLLFQISMYSNLFG